jgi:hypothetical protein
MLLTTIATRATMKKLAGEERKRSQDCSEVGM